MKKLLSLLLIIIILLSFAGCNRKDTEDEAVIIPEVTKTETQNEEIQTEDQKDESENTPLSSEQAAANDNETKISGQIITSCGMTTPVDSETQTEQPAEQKLLGVFPDSLSAADRQTLKDIANSKSPTVNVEKFEDILPTVYKNYKFDSAELITLLADFEYTEDQYRCTNKYVITVNEAVFYIDSEYHHVTYGTNTHTLTDSEKAVLRDILDKNVIYQNFESIEGNENTVTLTHKNGEQFIKYSFKNKDADRLLMIITEAELADGQMPNDPEYEFLLFLSANKFVMSLDTPSPFIAAGGKIAYLTKEQQSEIQSIINVNCTEQNLVT